MTITMTMTQDASASARRDLSAPYLHFIDGDGFAAGGIPTFYRVLPPERTEIGWEICLELQFPNGQIESCIAFRIDSCELDVEARLIRASAELQRRLHGLLGGPDSAGFFEQLDALPAAPSSRWQRRAGSSHA